MIFDRVMPPELRRKWEFPTFCSLTFEVMHIYIVYNSYKVNLFRNTHEV